MSLVNPVDMFQTMESADSLREKFLIRVLQKQKAKLNYVFMSDKNSYVTDYSSRIDHMNHMYRFYFKYGF